MRLLKYILDGGSLWDSTSYTYPEIFSQEMRTTVENVAAAEYGLREMQKRVEVIAEEMGLTVGAAVPLLVNALIQKNSYKYTTLYGTTTLEYDPIENYRMVETEESTQNKGAQTDAHTHGAQSETFQHGRTNTRTYADTETTTLNTTDTRTGSASVEGESSSTEGARTDTNEAGVYGFNSSTSVPADTGSATKGAQTNTGTSSSESTSSDELRRTGTEANAHTGTVADSEGGTDTTNRGSFVDQVASGAREDTSERTLTRSGNVGVTTSQQMIESERDVADFSFVGIVVRDIVNEICMGVL